MPLIATRGAASAQGFGEFSQVTEPVYIESVFSTWLYTGNGSTQTITNGIDLSTKGGMVWQKTRNQAFNHALYDTARGTSGGFGLGLISNSTSAQVTGSGNYLTTFNSNGFTTSANGSTSGDNWVSWTFRKQPKFFDVVTYTGDGVAGRTVSHNLGSTPGCIIVKRTDVANNWVVYHRSIGATQYGRLDLTVEFVSAQSMWNNTEPTQNNFTVGFSSSVNTNGGTYVAYLFAHNAGGFGLTGSDNVISCGSYTGNGSTTGPTVTLGYEPQWLMIKRTDSTGDWILYDTMRGLGVKDATPAPYLRPNSSAAEVDGSQWIAINATGFNLTSSFGDLNVNGATYIYIAIRRGPMKTPTSGTSVYQGVSRSGTGATATITAGFPVDLIFDHGRTLGGSDPVWQDRLRGIASQLFSNSASAESTRTDVVTSFASNTSITVGADGNNYINTSGFTFINWMFQRAPGFFDEICWTATGSAQTLSHNLQAVPELMIRKRLDSATGGQWDVYAAPLGATNKLILNDTSAVDANTAWNNTTPTSSVVYMNNTVNGWKYVTYLFASLSGVSKVGSYTGTGALQTVNCGFTTGARFVLIKRTDSTGDWWVYDSARGISSGNDPYVFLNSGVAEVTNTNYVDTTSVGFQVTAAAPAGLNANGGSYIFLAVA